MKALDGKILIDLYQVHMYYNKCMQVVGVEINILFIMDKEQMTPSYARRGVWGNIYSFLSTFLYYYIKEVFILLQYNTYLVCVINRK